MQAAAGSSLVFLFSTGLQKLSRPMIGQGATQARPCIKSNKKKQINMSSALSLASSLKSREDRPEKKPSLSADLLVPGSTEDIEPGMH